MERAQERSGGLRIWGRAVLTALVVGALVGAGQLGVAYGLGIVRLARTFDATAGNQWNAQLAWVSWLALLAAVAGAIAGERVVRRDEQFLGAGARIVLALCGGGGAVIVVPLSMQPARIANLAQSGDPALVVGLAAGLGVVAGVLVAVAALSLRALAWNVAAVSAVVWLAGLAAIGPYLAPDAPLPSIRLGVPQWTVQAEPNQFVDLLGMPVLAWLTAVLVAAATRAQRAPGLASAISGMAGAAPLALAYLIAGPGTTGETADQMAPYLGALIAVPAGLLGSLLVIVVPRRDRKPATARAGAGRGMPTPVEPTNIIPPIPRPGPRPAAGVASVPKDDDTVGWVGALSPSGQPGGPLPRRTPGQRFPAGT
jgi:hypothetical protein